MRSSIIVALAAAVGMFIAYYLFFPDAEVVSSTPTVAVTKAEPAAPSAPDEAPADENVRKGPSPINAQFQERINQPDAALAGNQASSWTVIRRELGLSSNPAAKPLLDESSDLVRDLREARIRPDSADFGALAKRQTDLRAKIEQAGLTNPMITEQLKRIDDLTAADKARAAGTPASAPPAAPANDNAPPSDGLAH
jgi:hypothetical protein